MNEMMTREIAAQPETLLRVQPELARLADALSRPRGRLLAGGCGDSAFAPRALSEAFRRMGTPIEARSAMELCGFVDLAADDTVILSSISGGTKRSVEAARVARERGATVIAVTCNGESALALAASETIVLPFTPLSRKTPHTLDYAVTLLALAEIARSFAGLPADAMARTLQSVPSLLAAAPDEMASLAATYASDSKLFILGAGPDIGTAEYGAAKFHEAGGLAAIAAETENFVHGMNFMIEPEDTLVVLGGTQLGLRRGRQVADAFAPIAPRLRVLDMTGTDESWETALVAVLRSTFALQHLCLMISDRIGLSLEEPRAGRSRGPEHLELQSRAMAS